MNARASDKAGNLICEHQTSVVYDSQTIESKSVEVSEEEAKIIEMTNIMALVLAAADDDADDVCAFEMEARERCFSSCCRPVAALLVWRKSTPPMADLSIVFWLKTRSNISLFSSIFIFVSVSKYNSSYWIALRLKYG